MNKSRLDYQGFVFFGRKPKGKLQHTNNINKGALIINEI